MRKQYVTIKSSKIDEEVDGEKYLARVVIEDYDLTDIGILDAYGNKIFVKQKTDPVGFIRRKE